jgi:hypothetical protein
VPDMCRSALGPPHLRKARMDRDCDLWGAESHEQCPHFAVTRCSGVMHRDGSELFQREAPRRRVFVVSRAVESIF